MWRLIIHIIAAIILASCSNNTNKVNSITNPVVIKKYKYSHYAIDNLKGNKHIVKKTLIAWKDENKKEKYRKEFSAEPIDLWGCPTYY